MAQIEKRANGAYRITVYLGKNEAGIRKYKRTTYHPAAKTPAEIDKEVRRFADQYEDEVKNGKIYSDKMTFERFVKVWRENYADGNIAVTSLDLYLRHLDNIWLPEFGTLPIGKISAPLIQSIINKQANKVSYSTIESRFAALRSIMTKAYKWDMIKENPCDRVELPRRKQEERKIQYFTAKQARAFLESIDKDTFWSAYFTLAIYGGFRKGELCGLTWKNIDFKAKTISVTQSLAYHNGEYIIKEPKTAKSRRTIPLPDICFVKLKRMRRKQKVICPDGLVFMKKDKHLSLTTPGERFRRAINKYNDTHDDKLPIIRLHDLRHTTATLLIDAGVPVPTVSYILGHARISTTLDIYTEPINENARGATETLGEVLKG